MDCTHVTTDIGPLWKTHWLWQLPHFAQMAITFAVLLQFSKFLFMVIRNEELYIEAAYELFFQPKPIQTNCSKYEKRAFCTY